eukprot:scaffold143002_cov133-Phaeocystis_antarctica.AAC.1
MPGSASRCSRRGSGARRREALDRNRASLRDDRPKRMNVAGWDGLHLPVRFANGVLSAPAGLVTFAQVCAFLRISGLPVKAVCRMSNSASNSWKELSGLVIPRARPVDRSSCTSSMPPPTSSGRSRSFAIFLMLSTAC